MVDRFSSSRLLLIGILLVAFVVRLYGFSNPVADWHSWRQVDTSSVSRTFVNEGYDLLHPKYDDLSSVPSRRDNPEGYRFVEFPLYNAFQAGLYQSIGIFTLEEWGRAVTISSSLFTILLIYLLMRNQFNERAALASAAVYAFLPYSIYYSRVILPDPSMVASSLAGVYFFIRWLQEKEKRLSWSFFISAFFVAISLLLKPYALFFLLPIVALSFEKYGRRMFREWRLYLFLGISILPLLFWRVWMLQYPEGIPQTAWLFNSNGIRFKPAFFRWILYERVTVLFMGYFGLVFLFSGLYQFMKGKKYYFLGSLILGSLLYVVIFATGNVQHDYYQILILPTITMICGLGIDFLASKGKRILGTRLGATLCILIAIAGITVGVKRVQGYYYINNPDIVTVGRELDTILPYDAKVVAPYGGDTAFLYQINRKGWPVFDRSMKDFKEAGATHLVFLHPTQEQRDYGKRYAILKETDTFILLDITRPL